MVAASHSRSNSIKEILAELNDWERNYGNTYGENAGLASTGEATARINTLKNELCYLGVVFQWSGEAYEHVSMVDRGKGYQLPDKPQQES